jgi:hypothetical protein
LHLELFDCFRRRRERHRVDARLGDSDTVERGVLVRVALPVGADADRYSGHGYAAGVAVHISKSHAAAELNPGLQYGQRPDVTAVERQLFHSARRDHLPERGLVRV